MAVLAARRPSRPHVVALALTVALVLVALSAAAGAQAAELATQDLYADLDRLASADGTQRQTLDAAVLEFDFMPDRDQVFFDYVFASEEYNEYVGSDCNDVFGFFVNDTNCADVGDDPVSINTINGGNPDSGVAPSNSQAYIDNTDAHLATQMDGLTVVLQCVADVTPGQSNHMKLAIADTSDTILDAAVFIRAGSFTTEPPPAEGPTERVAGVTRIETAVEVSELTFESATPTVVIARSDTYPDTLAGAPLARREDAPILLTNRSGLHPAPQAEINRLGATRAILLGGPAALSPQVEADLLANTPVTEVERIGGENRFATAALIAEEITTSTTTAVFIAEGEHADEARGWPDALAVSPLAAYQQHPILLVNRERLPEQTRAALAPYGQATVVGGLAAVSQEVEDAIEAEGLSVERVSGATRYETSRAVADVAIAAGMDPAVTYLASGLNFADALVGGPAVAEDGGVLVLSARDSLDQSPPTRDFFVEFADQVTTVYVLGGASAISDAVVAEINDILSG